MSTPLQPGFVSLVGAGPGDPDLLTVKGLRLLREADVIVHDRLANPVLLSECRADAELIFVGKHGEGLHVSASQERINALLIDRAKAGKQVVRLKGATRLSSGVGAKRLWSFAKPGSLSRSSPVSRRLSPRPPTPGFQSRTGMCRRR